MEATNPAGEEFGESRIVALIGDTIREPVNGVLRRITNEAVKFIEDGEFHDDLTIFIAKLAKSPGDAKI
jgi:serine phosphatase RsbU (regulator of sigma subunit)